MISRDLVRKSVLLVFACSVLGTLFFLYLHYSRTGSLPTIPFDPDKLLQIILGTTAMGLLAFQVVTHIALRNRIQGRRRLYQGLRRFGVAPRSLYERLGLNPVRMTSIGAGAVEERLDSLGAQILVSEEGSLRAGLPSRLYFATK